MKWPQTVDGIKKGLEKHDAVNLTKCTTVNEEKEQTYRENLNWAISAAGEFLRTNREPGKCPNNIAWFLYKQAIAEPKDFMAKVTQIESKIVDDITTQEINRSVKHSLQEIETFLENLKP